MNDLKEFWSKVKIQESNECWEWQAGRTKDGYGTIKCNGKMEYAHRLSFMFAFGEIPNGLEVLHKCDNPSCCNPTHLWIGTQAENMKDMREKGRSNYGEKNGNAKLTQEDVENIRIRYKSGEYSYSELGKMFGVDKSLIGYIIRKEIWNR